MVFIYIWIKIGLILFQIIFELSTEWLLRMALRCVSKRRPISTPAYKIRYVFSYTSLYRHMCYCIKSSEIYLTYFLFEVCRQKFGSYIKFNFHIHCKHRYIFAIYNRTKNEFYYVKEDNQAIHFCVFPFYDLLVTSYVIMNVTAFLTLLHFFQLQVGNEKLYQKNINNAIWKTNYYVMHSSLD